ncbi:MULTISPECIES: TOMM precursor leader peptide-binding protein [unclassified Paenibacillus]|uniref:TOMM precursor leader peptide-binding protein n=1 Tax=unclassified Paenibacillus TaxID=185978 RepID=UPI001AEA21F2|nr:MULTISPECIES: TOMM precursor leader peptide-binding protein [unclassified Paenibacillus]MBP1157422.1 ribosomal protein S12 methylthiotransferase accessory factor [Paenibacillus sp. PvP091]MBP1171840.1 ribosomal protein S12 methylthiotransferase accessory factor [Paenibacillus sp. PvR098]MBP2438221.1 ribosomal protein S12 methylthiotransferase accessory factor [Paenibacillus sp. PvP052]
MSGAVVLIVGEGQLAEFATSELSVQYEIFRQKDFKTRIPKGVDLALVLDDGWHPFAHQEAEAVLQSAGIPWVRGFVSFGEAMIGPLVRPGTPGCSQCADLRHLMGGRDRKEMWGLRRMLSEHGGLPRDVWASRLGLLQAAHLLAAEVRRILRGNQAEIEGRVFLINLQTLKSSRHFFLPDPQCAVCGRLPDDSPEAAQIALRPSPKINAKSYRCRPMDDLKEFLAKDYLDYRTGLLNGKMHDFVSPFADVSVNLPLFTQDEACGGRTHSYAESELTGIMEGLERYCGVAPRGKRTVIHDSFRRLEDQALDPVKVGVHDKEQYARPGFPFKLFDPDRPIDWVWGYSFKQERPILVPELLAYYSLGCGDKFVHETSNGCALGGSLEEAIFYGIMEVVERDSFLLTWYAQLPIPRLDLSTADDRELQLMIERLRTVAGFDVVVCNATLENGIPSVWALAKNRKPRGVNLICAAGAHPDPIRAVKSAIHELSGMMMTLDEKFEANRQDIERMFRDPFRVRHMEDHSMLYSLPQAEERLRFLLDEDRPVRTFDEEFKPKARHTDLTDDLKDILQVFRGLNLDVIVVDQTTPELRQNGLYCVKVLIPGMLPMTFGHHLSRLTGLERVFTVPVDLGYAKQPLTPEQLNPHPHPFP